MKKVKVIIFIAALVIGVMVAKVFGAVLGFGFPTVSFFKGVKGSGVTKIEKREVAGFKKIEVSGAIEVEITAQKDFSVEVEADDNLLEYVKTEVEGETLKIYTKSRIWKQNKIRVVIAMPELTETEVSGTVTNASGAPVKDVELMFQPVAGTARQATFILKADGKFTGTMTTGKYTYFFNEMSGKAAAFNAIPTDFKRGSQERTIEVKAGQPIDLKVQ